MAIPTVNGSEVMAAPVAAAPLNAQALMAPGQGMQSIARGISQVGEVAQQFQERRQSAINAAAQADATMQMEKAFNDYQTQMSTSTDGPDGANAEEGWVSGWQKKSAALKDSLLSDPKISPRVKDELAVSLSHMAGESEMRISTQANTRTIQRQKAKLTNVADYMFQNGDKERGDIAIDAMVQHGLIFAEEGSKLKEDGHAKADIQSVAKGLNEDPIHTLDLLEDKTPGGKYRNFEDLDETTRLSLNRRARTEIEAVRATTVRDFQDRINNQEIIKPDELQAAVDARRLTPQQFKWLNAQQSGKTDYAQHVVRMVDLTRRIDAWKPGDPDSEMKLNQIAGDMAGLPKEMQGRLESELHKVAAPGGSESKPTQGFAYIDHLLNNGFLGATHGMVETQEPGKLFGSNTVKKPVTREQAEATYGRAMQLRDALNGFVKAKPQATLMEQQKFINDQIQGQVDVTAATPVLNSLTGRSAGGQNSTQPQSITTKAQRDALPAGTRYKGPDGQIYIKK